MADKVVGFKIEIKGNKELLTTEKLLGMVNKQLTAINKNLDEINKKGGANLGKLSKQFKESATSAERLGTAVKSSFSTFRDGNKVVTDLGNGYFEVTRQVEKLGQEFKSSSSSISDLIARNKELKQVLQAAPIDETSEELEKLRKEYTENDKAIKSFRKELRTGVKEQEAAKGSIIELRKRAKNLKAEYDQLTPAQRKFTLSGRNLRKQLLSTNKAIRKYNNSVSASGGLTKTLSKTLTRLFVGRSILSGAANVLRNVASGLSSIVEEGKGTDETLQGIDNASKGLTGTLTNVGKSFLGAFGGVISSVIENFSFIVFKVSESLSAAANSGGLFGSIISGIGSVLSDFPAIFGGVIEVFKEFRDIGGNALQEIGLRAESVALNLKRAFTAVTGGDTSAIVQRLAEVNQAIEDNNIVARGIGQAYREGFENTKAAQEEFNARTQEEVELQEKRERIAKASEEASKKRAAAEKKRIEELAKDRNELLKQIEANAQARIELTIQLNAELRDAEIAGIQNTEERAIAAEKERFERQRQARIEGFNQLIDETVLQEAKIIALFGEGSQELIEFQEQTGKDLLAIQSANNSLSEDEERQHQETLLGIKKQAAEAEKQLFFDEIAETEALEEELLRIEGEASDKKIALQLKEAEQRKKIQQQIQEQTKEQSINLVNTTIQAISDISNAAFAAENQRFEESIAKREATIAGLNEDLSKATGLQKKFLERQIEQEEEALQAETEAKEKARKEQAETQKAIAITQAIIAAALGIANAFQLPPPASFIAAAATAVATAAQIAVIASQKFAEGGILQGPSHSQGGIKTSFGELEGGEAVINKRSTSMFGSVLSQINQAGGGRKFQTGGVLGSPISAPSLAGSSVNQDLSKFLQQQQAQTAAINNRIDRIQVVQDLNNLQDIQDNDNTLDTLTTFN